MPIYLYVKTHMVTGLKYLGKTSAHDPHKYLGSGKRWRNHLKKHGCHFTTTILLQTDDPEQIKATGIFFSRLWNIVESSDWANLKEEAGDGGAVYWEGMHEHLKTIAPKGGNGRKNRTAWNSGLSTPRTPASIEKQRKTLTGVKRGRYQGYNYEASARKVIVSGVEYRSISEAMRETGHSYYKIIKMACL